jgi:hypothetical protein
MSSRLRHTYPQVLDIDSVFFDVTKAQQVLVSGSSVASIDDAVALGVVPQKVAFVIRQVTHMMDHPRVTNRC